MKNITNQFLCRSFLLFVFYALAVGVYGELSKLFTFFSNTHILLSFGVLLVLFLIFLIQLISVKIRHKDQNISFGKIIPLQKDTFFIDHFEYDLIEKLRKKLRASKVTRTNMTSETWRYSFYIKDALPHSKVIVSITKHNVSKYKADVRSHPVFPFVLFDFGWSRRNILVVRKVLVC